MTSTALMISNWLILLPFILAIFFTQRLYAKYYPPKDSMSLFSALCPVLGLNAVAAGMYVILQAHWVLTNIDEFIASWISFAWLIHNLAIGSLHLTIPLMAAGFLNVEEHSAKPY